MADHDEVADLSKHTDAQLRAGIAKLDENAERVAAEDSAEAREAQRRQRDAMAEELQRRQGGDAPAGTDRR